MYLDILIFAIIAAFLIYRLNAVLGTRPHDDQPQPNPFTTTDMPVPPMSGTLPPPAQAPRKLGNLAPFIDATKGAHIEEGLQDIADGDPAFNIGDFMGGATYAFETIVAAYSRGDRAALRPLLSEKLFSDFDHGIRAREDAKQTADTKIRRVKSARITAANLSGVMAYVTVDFDVEQTSVVRDSSGAVIEGSPDRIAEVEDIWTFTRDIRTTDPNWTLIETRAAEK